MTPRESYTLFMLQTEPAWRALRRGDISRGAWEAIRAPAWQDHCQREQDFKMRIAMQQNQAIGE